VRKTWLAVVRDPADQVVAGEMVVASDGYLHSYLAGTRSAHRYCSPGKNATLRVLDLADKLDVRLNVGGGRSEEDGLEASKDSYANASEVFYTHEIVSDPARYVALAPGHEGTGFFPAYRAR
jgi:hypothetical protein